MASKSNADTSKLSHEEIEKLDLHGSKRPPGKSPGGVLHQQGGGLRNAGKYPMALYSVLLLTGVGTYIYYRNSHPQPDGQAGSHSPTDQRAEEAAATKKA